MPDPVLQIDGMEALLAKIDRLAQSRAVAGALLAGGAHLKTAMQVYPNASRPTRASIYGKPFQSRRQQRYFFYALKAGLIQVPYRRGSSPGSRNLKQQWTVQATNDGMTVEIGNNTPYGPLVQGQGRQSLYMKAVGWQTEKQVLAKEGPVVVAYVRTAIETTLNE